MESSDQFGKAEHVPGAQGLEDSYEHRNKFFMFSWQKYTSEFCI